MNPDWREMPVQILLMSVRPSFAEMLLAGTKTVEVRRVRPTIGRGDWVLIYATSPKKALLGAFQVADVVQTEPARLWSTLGDQTGLSDDAFFSYFRGTGSAVGIRVGKTVRFEHSLSLASIREHLTGFHPPQSYSYVVPGSDAGNLFLDFAGGCLEPAPS